MSSVLDKLRWSIQHRGLGRSLQAATHSVLRRFSPQPAPSQHPFDQVHGTDTGGLISGGNLASGHPSDRFITGYAAVPPSRFKNIFDRWLASDPPHSIGEYTFVDIGCGKGRAVLLASEFGFREVVGIELNPSLAAIARDNVAHWSAAGKGCCPIRIQQADATEFTWPAGPCVAFLFNPFGATVMQRVAGRMAEEFRDRPGDLEVIYYKPEQADVFENSFEMIWCEATGISAEDFAVAPVADPRDETRAYRLLRRKM